MGICFFFSLVSKFSLTYLYYFYNLKNGFFTTAHLLGQPKSRIWTPPTAGKNMGSQELSLTAGGDAK